MHGVNTVNSKVYAGQYAAAIDKPVIVTLIGFRINKLWAIHHWLPFFVRFVTLKNYSMRRHKTSVLLSKTWFAWREIMLLQYWSSLDSLEEFAQSNAKPHIKSWRDYNKKIAKHGSFGIWHEMYYIEPDCHESVYNNMPRTSLARATKHHRLSDGFNFSQIKIKNKRNLE